MICRRSYVCRLRRGGNSRVKDVVERHYPIWQAISETTDEANGKILRCHLHCNLAMVDRDHPTWCNENARAHAREGCTHLGLSPQQGYEGRNQAGSKDPEKDEDALDQ